MGSKATEKTKRRRIRRRMEAQGYTSAQIERALLARTALRNAQAIDVDDSGFRPTSPNPLLVGQGRVTGMTAKAVKRTTAITDWQYREIERREGRAG